MTDSKHLSACHKAPTILRGGIGDFSDHDEVVTMHYECTECHEPCDIWVDSTSADDQLDDILEDLSVGHNFEYAKKAILQLLATTRQAERLKTASDIFSLAHEYARQDKTMIGAEELRSYHYYNAISKIGEFDGR